jgi:capsular polysaccharide transport system permease protein
LALFDATLARLPTTSLARTAKVALTPAPPKPAVLIKTYPPAARRARLRPRHMALILSFVLCVLLPGAVTSWYLWARAADQYASTLGFSVRKENVSSALELLGGIASISGSSSADTDILYDYMHSQKLVAEIDADLDLRKLWSKPQSDPIFAYTAPGSIETLMDFWQRQVQVTYDNTTRLIEIRVLAFDPDDAQRIATLLFDKSTAMINRLNDAAQADALRLAGGERDSAEARLKSARAAVTDFRNRTQSVDPAADMQNQAGLLANLQSQLAQALIDSDMLTASTRNTDIRGEQAALRIKVIEDRIAAEREKLGLGANGDTSAVYATLVGDYERLSIDREFAETAYRAAQLAYEAAQADARRQTLYLAAHIAPTLAETAQFPRRQMILGTAMMFLCLAWSIAAMVYYSVRDRR